MGILGPLWISATIWSIGDVILFLVLILPKQISTPVKKIMIPTNVHSIVKTFNTLFFQCLIFTFIVPNAFYPDAFDHPYFVIAGDFFVSSMAICFNIILFDIKPISLEKHALNHSHKHAILFFIMTPFIILGISGIGCGMHMLMRSVGKNGWGAFDHFSQFVLGISLFITWGSLAIIRALHYSTSHYIFLEKIILQCFAAIFTLIPMIVGSMGDFSFLVLELGINTFMTFLLIVISVDGHDSQWFLTIINCMLRILNISPRNEINIEIPEEKANILV